MKNFAISLSAASLLVLAGVASAGQQLTSAEMDGVTAGGFAGGFAWGTATGPNVVTYGTVNTWTAGGQAVDPQAGVFYPVTSHVDTEALAVANAPTSEGGPGGGVYGAGATLGQATGNLFSETASGFQDDEGVVFDATTGFASVPGLNSSGFATNSSAAASVLEPATAHSFAAAASGLSF
ncbi:hypothetical protein [Thiocystis violascens]|uniref:Uncharacterized protein n=1 Tax=Thiocystis violascens (strain ATCC 17096 / DSM 198 / 6111) TaxID=765911 RepID=I3Y535_THIV6|nr:hypothetical protein [Thiocystis violascens]AFL72103.1 hypothetical protein Thivi_0011 [Thiocystis violascens DSM 198]